MQVTSCDTNFLLRCKHNKTHVSIKGSGELLITQLQIPHHAAPTQKLHNMQSRDEFYTTWLWYFGRSDLAEIPNQAANRRPRADMIISRNHNIADDEYNVALAPLKCWKKAWELTYISKCNNWNTKQSLLTNYTMSYALWPHTTNTWMHYW